MLGIDLWHTRLAAATRAGDGWVTPVTFDGAAVTPTAVTVTADGTLLPGSHGAASHSYVRLAGQRLHDEQLSVGSVRLDPVDVMAAVLARVADNAPDASRVVIATPAGWTRHQRERLTLAASRAGLAQPQVISGAQAILQQLHRDSPLRPGQVAAVIRLDDTAGELALIQRRPDGIEVLAAIDFGEVGEIAGKTLVGQAANAFVSALDASSLTGDQVAAVFCDAPPPVVAALASALASAVPSAPAPVRVGELVAAFGATGRTHASAGEVRFRRPARNLVRSGATAALAFAAAVALTVQQLSSGVVYPATSTAPARLVMTWQGWGLAPVFAVLGVVAIAVLAAELHGAGRRRPAAGPDMALGAGLLLSAALGVGGAVALALLGAVSYGVSPAPLLAWTLLSTLPLAAVLVALGVVVTRAGPPAGGPWWQLLQAPLPAVLVGAVSTAVLAAAHGGVPPCRTAWRGRPSISLATGSAGRSRSFSPTTRGGVLSLARFCPSARSTSSTCTPPPRSPAVSSPPSLSGPRYACPALSPPALANAPKPSPTPP